ncbi:uncharacterized protein UV8b_04731 [Ustilaginoidea virens]|uniref:Uncharacterized protein n=1 Tax=Ustilaginoidea virens TaxID=1159556 RepID=A0A8E5HSE0_USTVR|nr:uncharacterized protein UV8b_04731 [Ustilaginoidea virens]QUC20490.1 hypothetical protein UV8b_04731 [Ustilaginoidea virens]
MASVQIMMSTMYYHQHMVVPASVKVSAANRQRTSGSIDAAAPSDAPIEQALIAARPPCARAAAESRIPRGRQALASHIPR